MNVIKKRLTNEDFYALRNDLRKTISKYLSKDDAKWATEYLLEELFLHGIFKKYE